MGGALIKFDSNQAEGAIPVIKRLLQPIYDKVNYAIAGAETFTFFVDGMGESKTLIRQTAAGTRAAGTYAKSYLDTNMQRQKQFDVKLVVFGISLAFMHSTFPTGATEAGGLLVAQAINDREAIRQFGYMDFIIGDNHKLYLPLIHLPIANPISAIATVGTNYTMYSDEPTQSKMFVFPKGGELHIPKNYTVQVEFKFPTVTPINATLDMLLTLWASTEGKVG